MMPVQLPASQQTPLAQLATPVQFALHSVPEQIARPLHEAEPLQLMVVSAVTLLETSAAHARSPEHSTAHDLPRQRMGCAHESVCLHLMSQDCASQTICPVQVPAPSAESPQATLQVSPEQTMGPVHEPSPTQAMLHERAEVQSTVEVHAPAPTQLTVHGIPGGQTRVDVQEPAPWQSMVHVPAGSQVPTPASAQIEGHTAAASIRGPASASDPASVEAPSLDEAPSSVVSPSRAPSAPVSTAVASSGPNTTSGKEHAAARRTLAPARESARKYQRVMGRANGSALRKKEPAKSRVISPRVCGIHGRGAARRTATATSLGSFTPVVGPSR